MKSLARQAIEAGATKEEITEALLPNIRAVWAASIRQALKELFEERR